MFFFLQEGPLSTSRLGVHSLVRSLRSLSPASTVAYRRRIDRSLAVENRKGRCLTAARALLPSERTLSREKQIVVERFDLENPRCSSSAPSPSGPKQPSICAPPTLAGGCLLRDSRIRPRTRTLQARPRRRRSRKPETFAWTSRRRRPARRAMREGAPRSAGRAAAPSTPR